MQKIVFVLFFLISSSLIGQTRLFTIYEAVIGQYRDFYPTNLWNAQWKGSENNFIFQDSRKVYAQNIAKEDSLVLFMLSELNGVLENSHLDTLRNLPSIIWETSNEFQFFNQNYWVAFSQNPLRVIASIKLPTKAENLTLNYSKKAIAFTVDNNLYMLDATLTNPIQITHNELGVVSGQSISRNEFGIKGGIFWSPMGNSIAYYTKDERRVENYPLVNINAREAELKSVKYPMAGMPSELISVGIYTIESKATVSIEATDTVSEKYLTNLSWCPNEEFIYLQVLNRAQNHMKLNQYSAVNGSLVKTLLEEKSNKYVEPQFPILFLENDAKQFIYQTRNKGYNHAYLYNTKGELIRQVTNGNWEILEIIGLVKNDLYYTSTEENPTECHFYKINIKNGKKVKLTTQPGTHSITLNEDASYFIDNFSSTAIPRIVEVNSTDGKFSRTILKAANPYVGFNMPTMQIGKIKAGDDTTDIYYRLIKPVDFDSTRKYPAIVYVYGGPHAQLVTNEWLGGARLWEYYMAQKGYVMLTVDNRGTTNRGLEFENIIHRQCGVAEMKDQLKGIALLKSQGFVDMDRIGIHGWSYGGFMTTSLMVNNPQIFKVGVAGGPVIDWKYYEVMYGERYMDTPQENADGYIYTSLIPRAKDLQGKLLIIHGGMDATVVWQHSQLFINECIKHNIPVDFFVYPNAEHNVRGSDRVHLMTKVTQYFEDYLK